MQSPTPGPGSAFDRLVAPWPLLVGVVAAFLACCLAGHLAGRRNHHRQFHRFHILLSPQTLYYPTPCEVRALARDRLGRDRIVVIVGGSSITEGCWQAPADLWTLRLQALLGDEYQVINLGFMGAMTAEFGATAAEMLTRDYPRLILISDLPPGWLAPEPDGDSHKYFFWHAHARGWLLPGSERDAYLAARDQSEADARRVQELQAQATLDRGLSFEELWQTFGYTTAFTVWSPVPVVHARASFAQPRRRSPDLDQGPRPGHVYRLADQGAQLVRILDPYHRNSAAAWDDFERTARRSFPEALRRGPTCS